MKKFGRIEEGSFVEAPSVLRKSVSNPTEKEYSEFGYSPFVWDEPPVYDENTEKLIEASPYVAEDGVIHRCYAVAPLENIEAEVE